MSEKTIVLQIKKVPVNIRQAVKMTALRNNVTMNQWLLNAITSALDVSQFQTALDLITFRKFLAERGFAMHQHDNFSRGSIRVLLAFMPPDTIITVVWEREGTARLLYEGSSIDLARIVIADAVKKEKNDED